MTAQSDQRVANMMNELDNTGSLKESIVATIKQTIADEESKNNTSHSNNQSFGSDRQAKIAALPEIDHERSKAKINELMFNPSENESKILAESTLVNNIINSYTGQEHDVNYPDIPDISSFDNRRVKANPRAAGPPNKSMKNLQGDDKETLPIYKRRAKGPIKATGTSYNIHNSKL